MATADTTDAGHAHAHEEAAQAREKFRSITHDISWVAEMPKPPKAWYIALGFSLCLAAALGLPSAAAAHDRDGRRHERHADRDDHRDRDGWRHGDRDRQGHDRGRGYGWGNGGRGNAYRYAAHQHGPGCGHGDYACRPRGGYGYGPAGGYGPDYGYRYGGWQPFWFFGR